MPVNELEQHPYLQIGEAISGARMIVGTFPIYSLTNPRTNHKNQLQQQRGDISFFYGSQANAFWRWYKQFVDETVNIQNVQSILSSLQAKEISISDIIKGCSRINESFEDNKLRRKDWNLPLAEVINGSINKIICTSKADSGAMGWLRDKILMPAGFVNDKTETTDLHQNILNAIPGSNVRVLSIAQVLIKGQRKIGIVALPSPGSPERRLLDFGYVKEVHNTTKYLQSYLTQTFNWFLQ